MKAKELLVSIFFTVGSFLYSIFGTLTQVGFVNQLIFLLIAVAEAALTVLFAWLFIRENPKVEVKEVIV